MPRSANTAAPSSDAAPTACYLEDDTSFAAIYQAALTQAGYRCRGFGTIADCLAALEQERFDVMLVDWLLPDGTAEPVIRWTRQHRGWEVPVIVASAIDEEENIVRALSIGADDYVGKPVRVAELLARIAAASRRRGGKGPARLSFPPYEIILEEREIRVGSAPVLLTQKEFELAAFLFKNAGRLLSRVQLLDRVWGQGADIDTRTVDAHVSRLRKKLALDATHGWEITSSYGFGYRLEARKANAQPT